jgi:multiple sugar transport system permease protein
MTAASGSAAGPTIVELQGPRSSRFSLATRESISGYLFISPWIIGLLLFTLAPMIASFVMSFTDFDPRAPGETSFVGLANYERMLAASWASPAAIR